MCERIKIKKFQDTQHKHDELFLMATYKLQEQENRESYYTYLQIILKSI